MSYHEHEYWMRRALSEAAKGLLTASPNPMVGCVLVKQGAWVAEAFHERAGGQHAEVLAIEKAGLGVQGCDLYVSLEPCSHYGRTPPCVDAVIRAGIKRVWIADHDPNPRVNGFGIARLREAGIHVELGLLASEARQLNKIYYHFHSQQKPFVIGKWAMSLDGQSIVSIQDDPQISNQTSKAHSHRWRSRVDSILIGAGTLRADDPELTVRLLDKPHKQPQRIVLSQSLAISKTAKLFQASEANAPWIITTQSALDQRGKAWMNQFHASFIGLPSDRQGKIAPSTLLDYLAKQGITSLLIEGGMTVLRSFFSVGEINKILTYIAPKIIADLPFKNKLIQVQWENLDNDQVCEADWDCG